MLMPVVRRLRWPLLAAAVAALLTVSVAGATDNSPLVVGQNNGATVQTALQGSMSTPVFLITNFSTAAGAYGLAVNGNSNSTPAIGGGNGGSGIGFRGLSVSGIGALGIHTSSSGADAGAQGQTNSNSGSAAGVRGQVNSTSPGSFSAGVRGINNGTGLNGIGVYGSQDGGGWGVYGTTPSGIGVYGTSSDGNGVVGGSQIGRGVYGNSPDGIGVIGNSNARAVIGTLGFTSCAGNYGVGGCSGSDASATGVLGVHQASTGTAAGVEGDTSSTSIAAIGVLGKVSSTSPGGFSAGVRGINNGTGGAGIGGWFSHPGSGWGLYSTAGPGGLAGRFVGDVTIFGTLSKTAGSFKIDNPLHPSTEYLQHSFVESPDMMDVYNGNVTTDVKGFATIKLPAYFQALNRDFRYQLTIVGTRGWNARVVKEIAHNRFTIQTDQPNVKVSWQVTGIRHDAYANAHRIQVVVPKTGAERGKYVFPQLYGQAKSKSITALGPGAQAK